MHTLTPVEYPGGGDTGDGEHERVSTVEVSKPAGAGFFIAGGTLTTA